MDFYSINSINSYVKDIDMQKKWSQKKESGDFEADGISSISEWVEKQQDKFDFGSASETSDSDDSSDEELSRITRKYADGGKLTQSEKEYLRKNNPMLYSKVKAAEEEVKSYKRELKSCKTKDEVQKVKMNHVNASLSTVNSVNNNPNIPKSAKLAIASQELRKVRDMEKATVEFVKTGDYASLPTEAERRKAEHDIKEAEIQRLYDNSEKALPESDNEHEEISVGEKISDDEEKTFVDESASAEDISPKEERSAHERVKHEDSEEITVDEAENTDEARKVRRAKAKAVYASVGSSAGSSDAAAAILSEKV